MRRLIPLLLFIALPLAAADADGPSDAERAHATIRDMKTIAMAIESYATVNNAYPDARSVGDLAKLLEPRFLRSMPTQDGWGHDFKVESMRRSYRIVSAGSDGTFDEKSWGTAGENLPFAADAVYEDGKLRRSWP